MSTAADIPGGSPFYQEATAYLLTLGEGGTCRIDSIDELRGDFRRPRALKRHPGMFWCRLLDGEGRMLEETTMDAPDRICVVLDPTNPTEDGKPTPSRMTPEGPVVFQVRLPTSPGAEVLEIIRLAGSRDDGPGELVASLALEP